MVCSILWPSSRLMALTLCRLQWPLRGAWPEICNHWSCTLYSEREERYQELLTEAAHELFGEVGTVNKFLGILVKSLGKIAHVKFTHQARNSCSNPSMIPRRALCLNLLRSDEWWCVCSACSLRPRRRPPWPYPSLLFPTPVKLFKELTSQFKPSAVLWRASPADGINAPDPFLLGPSHSSH